MTDNDCPSQQVCVYAVPGCSTPKTCQPLTDPCNWGPIAFCGCDGGLVVETCSDRPGSASPITGDCSCNDLQLQCVDAGDAGGE